MCKPLAKRSPIIFTMAAGMNPSASARRQKIENSQSQPLRVAVAWARSRVEAMLMSCDGSRMTAWSAGTCAWRRSHAGQGPGARDRVNGRGRRSNGRRRWRDPSFSSRRVRRRIVRPFAAASMKLHHRLVRKRCHKAIYELRDQRLLFQVKNSQYLAKNVAK